MPRADRSDRASRPSFWSGSIKAVGARSESARLSRALAGVKQLRRSARRAADQPWVKSLFRWRDPYDDPVEPAFRQASYFTIGKKRPIVGFKAPPSSSRQQVHHDEVHVQANVH